MNLLRRGIYPFSRIVLYTPLFTGPICVEYDIEDGLIQLRRVYIVAATIHLQSGMESE